MDSSRVLTISSDFTWNHSFSTYTKFFKKLTFVFLPPDMHTYVCVSGGKKG